jgi:hypothetical protein
LETPNRVDGPVQTAVFLPHGPGFAPDVAQAREASATSNDTDWRHGAMTRRSPALQHSGVTRAEASQQVRMRAPMSIFPSTTVASVGTTGDQETVLLLPIQTLYGAYRCQLKNRHASESFCHVTSLHCGTDTPWLGCAEPSSPEAACGAPKARELDGECADRVTIIVPRRTNGFYFVSSPFIDLIGLAACRSKFDMIRGGARQRARKSRHSLVFG